MVHDRYPVHIELIPWLLIMSIDIAEFVCDASSELYGIRPMFCVSHPGKMTPACLHFFRLLYERMCRRSNNGHFPVILDARCHRGTVSDMTRMVLFFGKKRCGSIAWTVRPCVRATKLGTPVEKGRVLGELVPGLWPNPIQNLHG